MTASLDGKTSNTAVVTVIDPFLVSIDLTPHIKSVPNGVKVEYTAVGTYSDSSTHDLGKDAVWKSSDTDVATILASGISRAEARTHNEGVANITVNIGSIVSNVAELTVTQKEVFSLLITPAQDQTMNIGRTTQLTVTAKYTTGLSVGVTHDATWFSSASTVASVGMGSTGGLVTANSVGNADITAVYEGITSNFKKITVVGDALQAVAQYEGCTDGGDGYWHHFLLGSGSTGDNLTYKWTISADGSLDDSDRAYIDDIVVDAVLRVRKDATGINVSKIVAKLTVSNNSGESSVLVIPYFSAACN